MYNLGYGHGARRSLAAFKRLGIERVVPVTGRLWYLNGNSGGVDPFVAVGIALSFRCPVARFQVLLALDLHRKLEELTKDPPQIRCSVCDQMFQNGLNRRSVSQVHSLPPW